jgi:hypothetical protein
MIAVYGIWLDRVRAQPGFVPMPPLATEHA